MAWFWTDQLLHGLSVPASADLESLIERPFALRVPDDAGVEYIAGLLGLDPKALGGPDVIPTMASGEQCPCGDWARDGVTVRDEGSAVV